MVVRRMTVAEAESNFRTLTEYYFSNSRACSCLDHFSEEEAEGKIRSMIAHMEDDSAIVYGVFDGGQVRGYLWAYEMQFREERRVYVSEVYVDLSVRGQGFGTAMLEAVEAEARERGIPALYIHTEASNCGAIRLYENFGFQRERVQLRKALNG